MECSEEQNGDNEDKLLVKEMESDGLTNKVNSVEENKCDETEERLIVRKAMLDHLSTNDKVFFRCLKEDEEELNEQQKIDIAGELLYRNYGQFLAKFGNHLLKEHLCYFENRSEEESLIVDLHLKQLNRALEQKSGSKQSTETKTEVLKGEEMEIAVELNASEKSRLNMRKKLLDHLSLSEEAHFKSQQVGEPDLNQQEKRDIAEAVLNRSASLFLTRFGTHLLEEHLVYFDQEPCEDSYEIEYHLKQLRKTHCKVVSEVGIKNRRFEALKKLLEEGSYFCETEMRNRNPLLYEQLVGKFLTADERRERLNNIDTMNITFVNLLLEQMDRENVKKLKERQEQAEDNVMDEEDEEEGNYSNGTNEAMEDDDSDSEEDNDLDKTLWGEQFTDGMASGSEKVVTKREVTKTQEKRNGEAIPELSDAEKNLFMEEFKSNMFSSFLQGNDSNFDYSQVDHNPDYDDLDVQGQDEEEKYFDEESSQDGSCGKMSDEEDLLEQYMNRLKPEPTSQQLADKMQSLTHEESEPMQETEEA